MPRASSKSVDQVRKSDVIEVIVPVSTWRYKVVGFIFGAFFIGLIVRAGYLQVVDRDYLQSQGNARYLRVQNEPPTRGMIRDRNGEPLAISTPVDSIWMNPPKILEQKDDYSYAELTKLLGMSRAKLLALAEKRKGREFVYLRRHLAPHDAQKILALNVPGINSVREYKRYYPAAQVTGHVVGFTNIDNKGQEGLELVFDDKLKGRNGRTQVLRDRVGHVVEHVEQLSRVQHGDDVAVSIDSRIQYLAHRHLESAVKAHKAKTASLVALNAKTGEVLAMVSMPDFNPNDRSELKSSQFKNRSITDSFEPGSTMKPFAIAMALEAGVVTPDYIIDAQQGSLHIGGSQITDTKKMGDITVTEVIQKSSNVGSAKIAMMMGARDLYDTYVDLGFGKKNKLTLKGEQRGILANRKSWRPIEHATMSYGYGLSVNTLQLARAYLALANDGVLLPVSLHPVDELPKGERVFSSKTAAQVAEMLELAVADTGTAPKARVDQYRVGGKTGTAHKVINGRYQEDAYMSLFAGYAPISDPQIVLVVMIDDPRGVDYYGGLVAAPVFSEVMSGALRYMQVPPDNIDNKHQNDKKPLELMIKRADLARIDGGQSNEL